VLSLAPKLPRLARCCLPVVEIADGQILHRDVIDRKSINPIDAVVAIVVGAAIGRHRPIVGQLNQAIDPAIDRYPAQPAEAYPMGIVRQGRRGEQAFDSKKSVMGLPAVPLP